jgi:hypothetical protein
MECLRLAAVEGFKAYLRLAAKGFKEYLRLAAEGLKEDLRLAAAEGLWGVLAPRR